MDTLSIFGDRLNSIMYYSGTTPEVLAQVVTLDVSNIYRYLRKESMPSLGNALKIADYFNCSLDYLFGLSESTFTVKHKQSPLFSICFKNILAVNYCRRYRVHIDTHLAGQSLDDWYNGIRVPSVDSVIVLAQYFKCSLDQLLEREIYN